MVRQSFLPVISGFTDSCGQELSIYITHLLERIYYFETRQALLQWSAWIGWLKNSNSSSIRSFQISKFGTRSFSKILLVPCITSHSPTTIGHYSANPSTCQAMLGGGKTPHKTLSQTQHCHNHRHSRHNHSLESHAFFIFHFLSQVWSCTSMYDSRTFLLKDQEETKIQSLILKKIILNKYYEMKLWTFWKLKNLKY